ncbi:MAG: hypothetical protein Q4D92_02355 [Slackia sp.]|nr:hypothetical protein [Slackia sp.]
MALLRPSLTLVLDLDERLAGKDTILEIKRCYPYVGVPVVRSHAAAEDESAATNRARMIVGLGTRKYLDSSDDGADVLWDTVVLRWIGNMLHKIGSTMRAFNARQRRIGLPEIVFERIDIELEGGRFVVSLHTDEESFVDFDASEYVDAARGFFNDGTFAQAARVLIPSDESYDSQRSSALALWRQCHPEADSEASVSDEAEEAQDPADCCEEPLTREELLELDKQAKSYENTAVAPTDSDELPPIRREEEPPEPDRFNFEFDSTQWMVEFGDGSRRAFDFSVGEFSA